MGVIETFFLDWGLSLGTGMVFGLVGRRAIGASPPGFGTRAFRWGLAYLNAGIVGIALALYALRPDWMWMYWVDAGALPIAAVVLAFALYELMFVAGFAIAPALERARSGGGVGLAVAVGVAITIAEVATRARLTHFGTLEQFRAGVARALVQDGSIAPEGWLLLTSVPVLIGTLVLLAWRVARAPDGDILG